MYTNKLYKLTQLYNLSNINKKNNSIYYTDEDLKWDKNII